MIVEKVLNDFTKAIGALSDGKDLRDNFRDFLDFSLFFFCSNPTHKQVEWFNKELIKKRELYTKAILLLGDGSEGFNDLLGEFFMREVTMGRNGQYFTPEPVCKFMAKITGSEKGNKIADSCCGSGRMLLAHADNCEKPHNKNYYGNDIDLICAKMCALNLLLNSLTGVVTCGNGLIPIWVEGRETYIISTKKIDLGGKFVHYPQYTYYSADESLKLFIKPKMEKIEPPTNKQLSFTETVSPIGNGEQLSLF